MEKAKSTFTPLKTYYGLNLAHLFIEKLKENGVEINPDKYLSLFDNSINEVEMRDRIKIHTEVFYKYYNQDYKTAISELIKIIGDENPHQTGMFTFYYWIMPIAYLVEKYGIDDFTISIQAIEEITKRNTGEYTVRPFIEKYPSDMLVIMKRWAADDNFHLRRLACEGLRPKLPWAKKLNLFIKNPKPVFEILSLLKEDKIMFIKKSVGNHLNDYLKENPILTFPLLEDWMHSPNPDTRWIIKHSLRTLRKKENPEALRFIEKYGL